MTVSMRKMSPGDGYRYLLRTVAAGDGNRSLSTPLTRYYAEAGTPPGWWTGSGLSALGAGEIVEGNRVHESQLALLVGLGRDPVTGEPLGRAFPEYTDPASRIAARVAQLPVDLGGEDRSAEVTRIEAEERADRRRPVAGFDFTFSVPKSVSTLWAVADADVQAMIVEAHHAAVVETLDYFEREVAATRAGVSNGSDIGGGAVAQVGVVGVAAAAFDHYDSRAGDPQLHTHVVISNKVKTLLDGRWRSLDSRPVHAAVTAVSAHYDALLADRLAGTLGVGWAARHRGPDRNTRWEIAGVPDELLGEFSSRSRDIEAEKDRLVAAYVDRHGRRPSRSTIVKLRAQATLATRPEKQVRTLAELTGEWRARAHQILRRSPANWGRHVVTSKPPAMIDCDGITTDQVRAVAGRVVTDVSTKRSTWRRWNLYAEASRQTMGWRFATAADREAVVARVVEAAELASVALTPPELAPSPVEFRREDGTSVFRPRHSTVYSSTELMAAEDRLLVHADDLTAPASPASTLRRGGLSRIQLDAITQVATSRRRLDVLVGPAGAGKTTAMRALRNAWIAGQGSGSVVGLAPSAAAAQVLGEDLGVRCENSAKWLHEYDRGRTRLRAGQLVIVDEATLADTRTLDRLTSIAAKAGAKVLLVGDPAQLQSVDAGGAFAMLVDARPDVPELSELHRFVHDWEKAATLDLRAGRVEAISAYARHDRLRDGSTEQMLDAAYTAWKTDTAADVESILVTDSRRAVDELNARARADRILATDQPPGREVDLRDGARATAGDVVITRRNDRRLLARDGSWVRNGDRWVITDVQTDGSVVVRRAGRRPTTGVLLPGEYVAEHLDLGYAVTAHRAQGVTVDTAHVVVSSRTTRENLYVSMTRGRSSNVAYVALDEPDDTHAPPDNRTATASTVLYGVLHHQGAELSAHQTITAEQGAWTSIAQLAAEYDTLAAAAQRDRWIRVLRGSGLAASQVETVVESTSFGPLCALLRRTEAQGKDPEVVLRHAVARRTLQDAEDVAAVLHRRLTMTITRGSGRGLIAGLIPAARGEMPDEYRVALQDREHLVESRAQTLADDAVRRRAPWVRRLGNPPTDPTAHTQWMREVVVVAAYRDRYQIDTTSTLGPPPDTTAQREDARLTRAAASRAITLAASPAGSSAANATRSFGR